MRTFTERYARLGTETAFAVGADAAAWAAAGHEVFPFHLGDMNLPTPEYITGAALAAIREGKTGYAPGAGIMPLREALAESIGSARGMALGPDNISVQPGGKPVIGKFLSVVLEAGDEALYPNPGYPIYESQIEYLGGRAVPYGYVQQADGFAIDREAVERQLSERTTVLVYNNYQNPIGAESTDDEMEWLAELAIEHDLWVLADEAYYDIRYGGTSRSIAAIPGMQDRTVILYTFSKKFAMTGWRLGCAAGPADVCEAISKFNTNIESCSNHFVQMAGLACLKDDGKAEEAILSTLRERRDALYDALTDIDGVRAIRPATTFYLFPDVTEVYRRKGYNDPSTFRMDALHETGVSFCSRDHFGRPLPGEDRVFVRFAYSGIDVERIREGIALLKAYWD